MKKPEQTLVIDTETSTDPATFVTANTTETVTIKKSQLDELMERLKRVEFAAEKSRLARFDENNKGGKGKVVRLRTIEGKVVISWDDMTANTVEKSPKTGAWGEDQRIRIHLEDKTSKEMDLVIFNRHFVHLEADVISETKLQGTNDIIFKVRTEDGREYEINNKFIN
jgi:hypothetical protein